MLGTDAFRAVAELKAVKRPVVLPEELTYQRRQPISGELEETFVPQVFHQAGISFALLPNSDGSLGERFPGYQAARCVRQGIPRQVALEAITINPARMLGLGDRLGTLEVGKEAYVLVLSGDPLDFNTWVDQAYVRGTKAYDRQEDVRLKQLLGMEERYQDLAKQRCGSTGRANQEGKRQETGGQNARENGTGKERTSEAGTGKSRSRKSSPRLT